MTTTKEPVWKIGSCFSKRTQLVLWRTRKYTLLIFQASIQGNLPEKRGEGAFIRGGAFIRDNTVFLNHGYQKVFSIWNHHKCLSDSFEYSCYGSTAILNFLILSVRGSTSHVKSLIFIRKDKINLNFQMKIKASEDNLNFRILSGICPKTSLNCDGLHYFLLDKFSSIYVVH